MSKPRNAYRLFSHVCKFLDETVSRKRKELKITQYDLAEKAGLTRNCIQQMECHEHMPLPSTMFKLLRALELARKKHPGFGRELMTPTPRTVLCMTMKLMLLR